MSYSAALAELAALAPELHTKPGEPRRKFSLDELRILLQALGNPHQKFHSILIAGTNGKGSTASTLAAILTASGMRTGLYTSPHLERVNERIRIDSQLIPDDDFGRLYFHLRNTADQLVKEDKLHQLPSYFESLTALAFLYFAEQRIDIAVLEVGLGGRLDATNIVSPLISIITDISFDHMEWLGDTIELITREKAGILRANGTSSISLQLPAANQSSEKSPPRSTSRLQRCSNVPALNADPGATYTLEIFDQPVLIDSPLTGSHQLRNRALAIAAAVGLKEHFKFPVTADSIAHGIKQAAWPGRLEKISGAKNNTQWILDVSRTILPEHGPCAQDYPPQSPLNANQNPSSSVAFATSPLRRWVKSSSRYSTKSSSPPSTHHEQHRKDELLAAAELTGTPAIMTASVDEAVALAAMYSQGGSVVVAGSVQHFVCV